MKKNLLIIALMAGILSALTGCGDDEDFSITQPDATAAVTTAEATATEAEDTTVTEETKAVKETAASEKETEKQITSEPGNSAETKDDINTEELKNTAYELFKKYNQIDCLMASAVKQDRSETIVDGKNRTYNRVTDENFTCVDDIRNYISGCLTGKAKAETDDILDLDGAKALPMYMDVDGQLYCLDGGRGCGFDFVKDSVTISDVSDTSFSARITSNNIAAGEMFLSAQFELKDGTWLISCIEKTF